MSQFRSNVHPPSRQHRRASPGSRKVTNASSQSHVSEKKQLYYKPPTHVFDEDGKDVTPLPLLNLDLISADRTDSHSLLTTPTDQLTSVMMPSALGIGTKQGTILGGAPFSRSVFTGGSSSLIKSSWADETPIDEGAELGPNWDEIRHKRAITREELTEDDLQREISINLRQTETFMLLDIPGTCLLVTSTEATKVETLNQKYRQLCASRDGNDLYSDRGMNTFNEPLKHKSIQAEGVAMVNVASSVCNWEMFDTYEEQKDKEEEAGIKIEPEIKQPSNEPDEDGLGIAVEEEVPTAAEPVDDIKTETSPDATLTATKITDSDIRGSMLDSQATIRSLQTDISEGVGKEGESAQTQVPLEEKSFNIMDHPILALENFRKHLFVMERAVNMNSYQPKMATYRKLPVIEALEENEKDTDLLAVGYGEFEYSDKSLGLVCCWCLKNPEFPERFYETEHGVTAIDWSERHPNLLGVGFHNGTISVYDVRAPKSEACLDTLGAAGRHIGPIWQLRWVTKEKGGGGDTQEVLISIATDGFVRQWQVRKGFESTDIMRLKRTGKGMAAKARHERRCDAMISKYAGGTCFDFWPSDVNMYLVGTEEGTIHKCSTSYNEQFLESYNGHLASPVYRVRWNPFVSDAFLSCSSDWSIKLWTQDKSEPVMSFHSSTKAVYDIAWSPNSSTVFACANEGAVELWDLSLSTLDPIVAYTPFNETTKITSVSFSKNSDVMIAGDSSGHVSVLEIVGIPVLSADHNQEEALRKVMQSSLATQMAKAKEERAAESQQQERRRADTRDLTLRMD